MQKRKVAVITGASRGIGQAIAMAFARNGYITIINYNGSKDAAEQTKKKILDEGGMAAVYQCNVTDEKQCETFIKTVVDSYGGIDVLVNNAGVNRDGLILKMSEQDFDTVIDTNLKGCFFCTRSALQSMVRSRFGRIINISSVSGVMGNAGQANYSASKAGIIGLTKSVAREVAKRNITVNAIAPGFIDTDMTKTLPDKVKDAAKNAIPMGRFGSVEDIAQTALFLASDEACYITGQVICVDGGMAM